MELTPLRLNEQRWLKRFHAAGYDQGLVSLPIPPLYVLEQHGLIERNPTTSGRSTHWRITERGIADATKRTKENLW